MHRTGNHLSVIISGISLEKIEVVHCGLLLLVKFWCGRTSGVDGLHPERRRHPPPAGRLLLKIVSSLSFLTSTPGGRTFPSSYLPLKLMSASSFLLQMMTRGVKNTLDLLSFLLLYIIYLYCFYLLTSYYFLSPRLGYTGACMVSPEARHY